MHSGGKNKISWSNDDLERFLKVRAHFAPHESVRSHVAMTVRFKLVCVFIGILKKLRALK